MNYPNQISGSLQTFFWLKSLNSLMRIQNLSWKKFGSGMENIRIRDWDKHPRPATLILWILAKYCSMDREKLPEADPNLDEDWGCLLITDQLNRNQDPQHCFKVPFSVQIISFKGYWPRQSITGWKLSPTWRKFWAEKQTQRCSGNIEEA